MALSCPTEENFAAVAKQLHKTAVEAEERIYELEYQLRAAANRPTIIQESDTLETGLFSGTVQLMGPRFGVSFLTTFNNTLVPSDEGVANNSAPFPILGEGAYEVGFTATIVASGAADVNSYRIIQIQQHTPDPSSAGTIIAGFRLVDAIATTVFESGNGIDVSIAGHLRIKANDRIFVTIYHTNTSSTLNVSIGARVWIHKVSDATLTAVL